MLPERETERLTLREIAGQDGGKLQTYQTRRENWCQQAVEPREYADGKRIERDLKYRGEDDTRRLYVYVARISVRHSDDGLSLTIASLLSVDRNTKADTGEAALDSTRNGDRRNIKEARVERCIAVRNRDRLNG